MPCIAHRLHVGQTLSVGVVSIAYFNILTGAILLILPPCYTMIHIHKLPVVIFIPSYLKYVSPNPKSQSIHMTHINVWINIWMKFVGGSCKTGDNSRTEVSALLSKFKLRSCYDSLSRTSEVTSISGSRKATPSRINATNWKFRPWPHWFSRYMTHRVRASFERLNLTITAVNS